MNLFYKMESQLKEGTDYYFDEKGLLVFTENYHLNRGYCCNSGCRHCPFKKEQLPEKPQSEK